MLLKVLADTILSSNCLVKNFKFVLNMKKGGEREEGREIRTLEVLECGINDEERAWRWGLGEGLIACRILITFDPILCFCKEG